MEEDESFLGGYDTWCGPGDLEAQDVTGDGYTVGGLLPHEEREEADATFLNSRKAVQTEFVTLTAKKPGRTFTTPSVCVRMPPMKRGKMVHWSPLSGSL